MMSLSFLRFFFKKKAQYLKLSKFILVVTLSKDEDGGVMERTVMLVWIQDEQEKIPEEDAGRTTAFATDDQPQATIRLLTGAKRQTGVTRDGDVVEMTQPMMPQPMMRQPMIPSLQDIHTHTRMGHSKDIK